MQTQHKSYQGISSSWYKSINVSNGSQSHRPQRGEWNKPTVLSNQKPLNSHRSIENKPQKKNDHLPFSIHSSSSVGGNGQTFLYSSYQQNKANCKNPSADNTQGRHLSLKGWNNSQYQSSTQQQNNILKNALQQNLSNNSTNSKGLQSSGSSSSLLLDSGIRNVISISNNPASESGKKQQTSINLTNMSQNSGNPTPPQVLTDIKNQFNTESMKGKQKLDLVSILSSFAPPQSTKSNGIPRNLKNSSEKRFSTKGYIKQNQKLEAFWHKSQSQDINFREVHVFPTQDTLQQKDQQTTLSESSIDGEFETHEDINESVIVFKQGTQKGNSQEPTPKTGSLKSYTQSLQSNEKPDINLIQKKNDSRNQLHSIYLSQQISNEINLIENNINHSSKTSQSSSSSGADNQIIVTELKSSSSKKENNRPSKIGKPSENMPKTPSDVFQYKLKSPYQPNLKLDNLLKAPQIKAAQTTKQTKIKASKKPAQQKLGQTLPKPPAANKNQKTLILNKSGSQDIFHSQKLSTQEQLTDIEQMKGNFMFQTQQFVPPPNSQNQDTPQTVSKESGFYIDSKKKEQILNEIDNNFRDDCQNIKVVARFRPFNKIELEMRETYMKKEEIMEFYPDQKTVKIKEEFSSSSSNQMVFTFDHVFSPNSSQEDIFERIGKETIDDIMSGYNGTIFAYGQTGSGKTFTMYGQDLFDEELMGIVPRAARQIFNHIRNQDLEIEYQIRIQMVEIYKESLRDLLHDSPEPPPELKIKEDPKRGTYVEGLTDVCIVSEEEIMTVLCTGETMRHVASTNLNQVSSRSHSICIIEIVQKYPNDSEKRGVLNLVDLAGSERVSKSHAQGQALEEAKKINFSLSMLGKVINSLTKNSAYIPYRDSKLTRLLKESLGGNNKTSLIVACSLHSSNIEETISTMRFAQSAKYIQNKIKMNIKTSPEHLQIIIQQLKQELQCAKEEICRLRITSTNQNSQQQNQQSINSLEYSSQKKENEEFMIQAADLESKIVDNLFEHPHQQQLQLLPSQQQSRHTLHNRPHQSLLAKNYDVIETNNQRMQMLSLLSSEFSSIPGTGTPNFISPVKNYEIKLMQLINRNEDLEMKLKSKDQDIEALKNQKEELQSKVSMLEDKIINQKQKNLVLEKKVAEYESDKDFMMVSELQKTHKLEDYQSQIEVLTQQVKCMEKALEDSEYNCQNLLKEKQQMYQKQVKEFFNETLKVMRIPVSQALDNFINKASDINSMTSFIKQFDLEKDYQEFENVLENSEFLILLKDQDLLSQNLYSLELLNAIEEGSVPPEITIYLLKHLLVESSLANHNLQRILAVNRWRQVIEFGKFKIKSEFCKIQENTINTLEEVLEKTRKTHDRLRARVDKLENHLYDNRNYYGDIVLMTENNNPPQVQSFTKETLKDIQKFNSLKDKVTNINNHNQSIVSMIITNSNQQQIQKTRFIKTITNKTLGKAFNFVEKSPHSRASMCGNQSLLSQYYGQKHKPIYKKSKTPMRTGGLNSPVVYNFQSPIRRQNTFGYQIQPQIIVPPSLNEAMTMPHHKCDNDPSNFEEAIVKFINSNEVEDKVNQKIKDSTDNMYFLTLDDLQKVEQLDSIQDVKDFIKAKFEKQQSSGKLLQFNNLYSSSIVTEHPPNPLFVQYQHNVAFHNQTQSNSQSSSSEHNNNQINSHTTNNNLYAQSNDFYDNNIPSSQKVPCSTSGNYHDNQRQEHVMTLASDYLITSNSVIGPNALFSNGNNGMTGNGNQYYQNEYMDRLQEKIVQLQEEVETQKCRAEEHKRAYHESKKQIEVIRQLMEEKEIKFKLIMRNEVCQWENALNKVKEMNEIELQKKQKEIEKLHELLAQWITSYQDLELNRGIKPQDLEKLLVETLRHKRNRSNLLSEVMKTPHNKRLSSGYKLGTSLENRSQKLASGMTINSLQTYEANTMYGGHINTMQQTYTLATTSTKEKNFENKKDIKGDNSPVPQEESCYDMDSSLQLNQNTNESESRFDVMNLQTYESNQDI